MAQKGVIAGTSVQEVMCPVPVAVSPRDLVTRARALMRESRVRVLPVIEGGRLEGVLTQRDLLRVTSTRSNLPVAGLMRPSPILPTPSFDLPKLALLMAEHGLDEVPVLQSPSDRVVVGLVKMEDILRRFLEKASLGTQVSQVMRREVVYCREDDDVGVVLDLMERSKFSGLPVVREEGRRKTVVGVITRSDLLRSGVARVAEESKKGRRQPKVRTIMRAPAVTVGPGSSLKEAIELMLKKNVKRLPVVEKGVLVGIVSRADIVNVLCR